MTTASSFRNPGPSVRYRFTWRIAALCLTGCLAAVGGAGAFAQPPLDPARHGATAGAAGESVGIVAHVSDMLQHMPGNAEPSAAQKSSLSAIIQKANADLTPLQEKLSDSHAKMFSLLTQPTIDRSAVEVIRAAQMDAAAQVSKRSTQFVIDVAEALTPEQRKLIAEHMAHHQS
ncbi:Spy/CpxP family protein refolding chaperone [Dyella telluris]|uniref:Signaling pathway modulator ZraP n=1 Tax=Dyella telluris TaxID=2763498 RepID=A0A7G8Q4Z4_9GAMM|nr:periplasmic heavy metal sensor [Dyella telluris]QNK01852.1 periplasmic heavy metal sensor [Dyella telluris]